MFICVIFCNFAAENKKNTIMKVDFEKDLVQPLCRIAGGKSGASATYSYFYENKKYEIIISIKPLN